MVYVIIGIALLFIIVPIIAVLPSARQKEQMNMRKRAREAGVSVELTTITDPNPKQEKYTSSIGRALPPDLKVVGYRIQRKRATDWRMLPKVDWCWQKRSGEGWYWREEPPAMMSAALKTWLEQNVPNLPADTEQVEESGYNIIVYWHERDPQSETIVLDFLRDCAALPLVEPSDDDVESNFDDI